MIALDYDYISYEEFLSFSDCINDYGKMEYYDGQIICMSPTHPLHNIVQNKIFLQLMNALSESSKCNVFTSDVAVKFENKDEKYQFEPDIMICCDDKFDKSIYIGVPKLVIEVLSKATQHRDLGIKLYVYEKCGVENYWIVDINKKEIIVYSNNFNGKFRTKIIHDLESSVVWNQHNISLKEIF